MAKEKCPLCGGKVVLEYCDACGYRVPDENGISSLYNYNPADYPVNNDNSTEFVSASETTIREVIPEVQADEIYPVRKEPIIPVILEKPVTDNVKNKSENDWTESPFSENQQNINPQHTYQNYQNNNQRQQQDKNDFSSVLSIFFKDTWWQILITIIFPFAGFIFCSIYKKKSFADSRYNSYSNFFLYGTLIYLALKVFI